MTSRPLPPRLLSFELVMLTLTLAAVAGIFAGLGLAAMIGG